MSAALLYRVAAVLLVLFAAGHQFGFRQVDPQWGVTPLLVGLKTTRFVVQGATRTFWGFFSGLGFIVTTLYLFSAVLAWQVGGLPPATQRSLRLVLWAFAGCYVTIALLSWRYFFMVPQLLASVVALCLILAAWRGSGRRGTSACSGGHGGVTPA